LERGRQPGVTPVARTPHRLAGVGHDYEGGEILVLGPEAVSHPGAEARPTGQDAPGVHLADAADVVDSVGPARADQGDLIDDLRNMGIPVGDPHAALAVLRELVAAGQEAVAA